MEDKFHKTQLCWTCARACGGCSWSHDFTPVKGWTAKKVTMYVDRGDYETHRTETYRITACPLYKDDTPPEQPKQRMEDVPLVKRAFRPVTMPNSLKDRVWKLPDCRERLERLTGELKRVAEIALVYNYDSTDAAIALHYGESTYRRRLHEALLTMEAME